MTRYPMNLRLMTAKYVGRCADQFCGQPIAAGERIAYDPNYRLAYHERCAAPHGKAVEAKGRPQAPSAPVAPAPREYGIGRVPADVNPVDEAMAEIEAAEIVARQTAVTRPQPSGYRPSRCSYRGCTAPATMSASLGPSCDEHYDDLSG